VASVEQLIITFDQSATAGATAAAQATERYAKGLEALAAAGKTTDEVVTRSVKSYDAAVKALSGVATETAKAAKANRDYEATILAIAKAEAKAGGESEKTQEERRRALIQLQLELQKAADAGKKLEEKFAPVAPTFDKVGASSGQAAFAMRQFGVQSVQAISGIATGQSVMTVFIQQGHQLVDVALATGTGFGVLGQAIKNAMLAVISPTGLAVTALAAFAAATYIAVSKSNDLEDQQRTLAVSLAATGRSADVSATSLQRYADQLARAGVSRADSQAIVNQLGRNQSLSQSQIGRITGIAPDLGVALGTDAKSSISGLEQIAGGSADAIRKLNDALHILSPAQESAASAAATHGHAADALGTVISALEARITGLHERSLSPTERTMHELTNGWNDFVNSIVNSSPAQNLLQGWANIFQSIANSVKGIGSGNISNQIVSLTNQHLALQADLQKNPAGRLSEMVGLDTRPQQLKALEDQILNLQDKSRTMADAVSVGAPTSFPGDYGPAAPPGLQRSLDLSRTAASRAEASDPGRIKTLTGEIKDFRTELTALGPRTSENALLFDNLTGAITADQKAIDDLTKKNEVHRTGLEKQLDTLKAQITAQNQLTDAYGQGVDAVAKVLAKQAAEKSAITDGLTPGTKKYADAVKELTARHLDLAHATGETDVAKQTAANQNAIQLIQAETNSIGMNNDARALMLDHLKNEQYLKDHGIKVEDDLGKSYLASTDAIIKQRQELANQQASYQALADIGANAFDRLGQSISDAFVSGSGSAVNFGNIIKAVIGSVVTDLLKLGVINPILNSVFSGGATRPTLGAALGVGGSAAGGSSSGGLDLGSLYQLGSGASSISGALGGPSLSSIGNSLGLTGQGGYFSGIGSTINGYLATPIYGGSTMTGLTGEAAGYAAQGGGALTVGGALGAVGGIGAGYGVGTTVGGLVAGNRKSGQQNAQIGSIVGSVAGAYFGPLGSIAGGAIGGALGGMLGPQNASPYALTNIGVGDDGRLTVGSNASQISGSNKSEIQAQVDQFNSVLALAGVRIANKSLGAGLGSIGSEANNPLHKGTNFAGGSVGDLLTGFKYSSTDPHVNSYLTANGGAGFSDLQTMATVLSTVQAFVSSVSSTDFTANIDGVLNTAEAMGAQGGMNFLAGVSTFVTQTVPAMTDASAVTGALTDAVKALTDTYAPAIAMAQQLGYKEQELTDARDKAITTAVGLATEQTRLTDAGFVGRYYTARATNDNNPAEAQMAALYNFDLQATAQKKTFLDSLVATFGDAYKDTQQYVDQTAYADLALNEERLTIQKQFGNDTLALQKQQNDDAARQTASATVVSISDYIKKFSLGSASPLSANSQYDIASRQFDSVANSAIGGNFAASQQFTSYADSLATSARTVYGSGAGYAAVVDRIVTAANQIASQGSEALTAGVLMAETRTQTQVLGEKLDTLTAEVALLRQQTQQAANIPSRAA
jgi:hypothetical protein